jgi:putative beta-lysine N-acetyltransferase
VDPDSQAAEMTDFATGIAFRGMGYATVLLKAMERAMQEAGILTVYTICRAGLYPINAVFRKEGYQHGGMLVKNTQICGHFESMHVWYRHLVPVIPSDRESRTVPADRLPSIA